MALTKAQRNRIEGYDRNNRECAAIILRDIEKYGGEGSGAVQWARLVFDEISEKENGRNIDSRPSHQGD